MVDRVSSSNTSSATNTANESSNNQAKNHAPASPRYPDASTVTRALAPANGSPDSAKNGSEAAKDLLSSNNPYFYNPLLFKTDREYNPTEAKAESFLATLHDYEQKGDNVDIRQLLDTLGPGQAAQLFAQAGNLQGPQVNDSGVIFAQNQTGIDQVLGRALGSSGIQLGDAARPGTLASGLLQQATQPGNASSIAGILNQSGTGTQVEALKKGFLDKALTGTGTADGQATVDAAKSGDTSQLRASTLTLQLINADIKANGGRVSAAEHAYLYDYYNATAKDSAAIDKAVKSDPSLRASVGSQYAGGLLNLSNATGLDGLPPAVRNILSSDIGKVQPTPQDGQDTSGAPMLRRAEWKDGNWVVDNYATDTGFADLLSMADHGLQGGTEFSRTLAEAGIRWKQDINAVQTNTTNWLDAVHILWNSGEINGPSKEEVALGFPPDRSHADTKNDTINFGISDTGASNALSTAARNSYAAAELLTQGNDRHAILGLNWQDGTGAADVIASGTAPDPHNEAVNPATGQSIRNEAALDVIKDTGSDYENFVKLASNPVKNALTNLAITHLGSFATVPEQGGQSAVGTLVLPGGQKAYGLSLNQDDAANFLKMIALSGPKRYGALHAAALQQGALWIHEAPGTGSNSGGNYASILDGRVSAAGFAAAQDIALQSNASDKKAYAAQLAEEQDQSTQELLGTIAFQVVDSGLAIASFGTSEAVTKVLDQMGALNGILSSGYDDYNAFNAQDANSPYIQDLQNEMQQALSAPHEQAQVTYAVQQDQAWMAIKAAALDPHHSAAVSQALNADGNPALPPGVLLGSDGQASPSVSKGNSQYQYLTSEAGKRQLINPLIDGTYGSANADTWGAEGINATLAGSPNDSIKWTTNGAIVAQITTGNNQIDYWLPERDPYLALAGFEDPHNYTPR